MSHPDPAPRGTPGRGTKSTSWLVAGAAAIILILVIIFWNSFGGPDEATIADDTPTVEEQENTAVDDGPLEKAGEAITDGPESPLEGTSDEANAVADEAAREQDHRRKRRPEPAGKQPDRGCAAHRRGG